MFAIAIIGFPLMTNAVAASFDITIQGSDAIFLAGRDDVDIPHPSDPWNTGSHLLRHDFATPEEILETFPSVLSVKSGDKIRLLEPATGNISFFLGFGPIYYSPDGNLAEISDITSLDGISGYKGPQGPLTGVFLDDSIPDTAPAPSTLDFTEAGLGTDTFTIAPELRQIFYIGDGITSTGYFQNFIAPEGATRLMLGIPDAFLFVGEPGNYDDNDGNYTARIGINEPGLVVSSELSISAGKASFDHTKTPVEFPDTSQFNTTPLVIVGPPTTNGLQPGNVRIDQVTRNGFNIQLKEYDYLFERGEGSHLEESADYLALQPGIYVLENGTIIEAGSFNISGTGQWITHQLSANFPTTPSIIATLQTTNGPSSVMIRLDEITPSSFKAALYEEEKLQNSGHLGEKAAYFAIYHPESMGNLTVNKSDTTFNLLTLNLNFESKPVNAETELVVEEEQSADPETKHFATETIDTLILGEGVFGQVVTKIGNDTIDLRKIVSK